MKAPYSPVSHKVSRPVDEDAPCMDPQDHLGQEDCINMTDGGDQPEPQMATGHLPLPTSAGPDTTDRAPQESNGSYKEEHPKGATRPRPERRPPKTLTYGLLGVPEYQRLNPAVNSIQGPPLILPYQVLANWFVPYGTSHMPFILQLQYTQQPAWTNQY